MPTASGNRGLRLFGRPIRGRMKRQRRRWETSSLRTEACAPPVLQTRRAQCVRRSISFGWVVRVSVPAHRRTSIWASGFGFDRDVAIVGVSVDRPFCTAEQSPRFVGSKIRNDVVARYELVADPFETVGLHDRRHHFAVNRKWYIDACALDQRGPVLIAESVSQFDTGA